VGLSETISDGLLSVSIFTSTILPTLVGWAPAVAGGAIAVADLHAVALVDGHLASVLLKLTAIGKSIRTVTTMSLNKLSIDQLDLNGKRVLIR
jgi:hypothetical protein